MFEVKHVLVSGQNIVAFWWYDLFGETHARPSSHACEGRGHTIQSMSDLHYLLRHLCKDPGNILCDVIW